MSENDNSKTQDNYKSIKKVLWQILGANLFVAILKIIFGQIIKSSSMTADGIHSLADGSSNIIGLIGISIASKPTDTDHPYGHKKFETLASLFISFMLFVLGCKIIIDSFGKLFNPIVPEISLISLLALLATLIINISITVYEDSQGQRLKSSILISDSKHTKSDIFITIGVLIALICVKLGFPPVIDAIASLIVCGFILYAAYEIFSTSSCILLDKIAVDTDKIKEITQKFPQVKNIHKIRSRRDEKNLYIDMHIMTEPNMSIEESHELIHNIENTIKENIDENIELIAHLEPFDEEDDDEMEEK